MEPVQNQPVSIAQTEHFTRRHIVTDECWETCPFHATRDPKACERFWACSMMWGNQDDVSIT